MGPVAHVVRPEGIENRVADVFYRGHGGERERLGGILQAGEVRGERGDPAIVDTQAFPHGVTALDDTVENGNASLGTRLQLAVDVDENVLVAGIDGLHFPAPWLVARIACSNSRSYHGWHSSSRGLRRSGNSVFGR